MRRREVLNRATHMAMMRARHFIRAGCWRGHHVHSPFVFHVVRDIITTREKNPLLRSETRKYRKQLMTDTTMLTVEGIGAIKTPVKATNVARIARRTSTSEKYGLLLSRIAQAMQPHCILELGTSMGMSTAYLAYGNRNAHIISLEGVRGVAEAAQRHLHNAGIDNVTVLHRDIDASLTEAIGMLANGKVEMAFVDANHSYEATMRYFEQIVSQAASVCTIIFDDIFWSEGMTKAWRDIIADERIKTTVELPKMGLAFIRTGCPKEHYIVRW